MASLHYVAAGIMAVLGGLHLVYALYDALVRPRYFRPADKAVLSAMIETRPAISPSARNYWLSVIGFNISHAIGVLMLALLIVLAGDQQSIALQIGLTAIAALYALISWRCWFWIPTLGSIVTAALLALAWLS